jgi:predicted methyltransferase
MESKTYTDEELQQVIAQKLAEELTKKADELTAKHNSEMAQLRKNAQKEREEAIEKAKADAKLSAEELAKKQNEETLAEKEKELAELRGFKQSALIKDKLAEAKLPTFLSNDARLLNSKTDDELKTAIEAVQKDFNSAIPSGGNINTNVQGKGNGTAKTEKELKMEYFKGLK